VVNVASLLSPSDTAKIAEHVAAAELGTAGEIVVVFAEQSGGYERQRAAASFTATLLIAVGLYTFVPAIPELYVLCGQAPLMLAFWWLSGLRPLTRLLVPTSVQQEAVRARSRQMFLDQGVTETRERSGVLVYLSEAERRVELLADRGIHEHVGAEDWQKLVDEVVGAIRKGRAADGVGAAVDAIGARLAQHFPPSPDDINELPDEPRRV
jgi:putative membrane protein